VERTSQLYTDMSTTQWWSDMQNRLPCGATIIPVIIGSDATCLTQHHGDQKAWPVYITIRNILDTVRNKPSQHPWLLIAYLPIPSFTEQNPAIRGLLEKRLYHYAMLLMLESI
jgi:hypothetical protein